MGRPTAESPIWDRSGADKRSAVNAMFADIAGNYDALNRMMSLNQDTRWRAIAAAKVAPKPGEVALDLCAGTGDFMPHLLKAVGSTGAVIGMDFCVPMLEQASKKSLPNLAQGDAVQLPLLTASVDVVTVGWGIRNVPDIDAAHQEIFRVLRPGGRFVSLDMAIPRNPVVRAGSRFVSKHILPRLGARFGAQTAYTYLPESTERFWSRDALADSMRKAGFVDVDFADLMFGNICLHFGRKK